MGLQDVFKTVAKTVITAFDDVPQYIYFHSLGTSIYDPVSGENVESGSIAIEDATDLSMITPDTLQSVSTDLSANNIPTDDIQWFKISGFTDSSNNGYARASMATATEVTLTQLTVETEVAGDDITIIGPFYKLKGIVRHFGAEDMQEDSPIQIEDLQIVIANIDLAVTPKPGDWVLYDDTYYTVILPDADPAFATWKLWLRRK
jgi:hypothetical protein